MFGERVCFPGLVKQGTASWRLKTTDVSCTVPEARGWKPRWLLPEAPRGTFSLFLSGFGGAGRPCARTLFNRRLCADAALGHCPAQGPSSPSRMSPASYSVSKARVFHTPTHPPPASEPGLLTQSCLSSHKCLGLC